MNGFVVLASLLASSPWIPAPVRQIRVEAGAIEEAAPDTFLVADPGLRAVIPGSHGEKAKIAFTYRGPSRRSAPLASGELRRQIGLKLRSRDTCNVVYVMWHIAPTEGLRVQVKTNPGMRSHHECRDRGYRSVRAERALAVPPIRVGEPHVLAAAIERSVLRVTVDDVLAWEGRLPDQASGFDGPAGIRSDNGEFVVTVFTVPVER